jgi:SAM-dependent methyltransferase
MTRNITFKVLKIPSKITKNFYSLGNVVSYFAKKRITLAERELFRRYLRKKGKVLDLFCGAGRVDIYLAKKSFDVFGIDNSKKMINVAKELKKKYNLKNVIFICKEASEIKFKNKFDYILLIDFTLGHISSSIKRREILQKIYCALKENGIFIIFIPSSFYSLRLSVKIMFHNIEYFIKKFIFFKNSQMKFNDVFIIERELEKDKSVFYHFFTLFEIKKILKKIGFKSFESICFNQLDKTKNRFKNDKVYCYLKPFFDCYLICRK